MTPRGDETRERIGGQSRHHLHSAEWIVAVARIEPRVVDESRDVVGVLLAKLARIAVREETRASRGARMVAHASACRSCLRRASETTALSRASSSTSTRLPNGVSR